MKRDLVRDGLRFKLAQRYQEGPRTFWACQRKRWILL